MQEDGGIFRLRGCKTDLVTSLVCAYVVVRPWPAKPKMLL
jgi:hypothetical protein